MSVTLPDPILPAGSDVGFSYEYGIDVLIVPAGGGAGVYQPVRFISNVDPQVTPVTQSAQTYEDKGAPNDSKTSESWTLAFYVQARYVNGELLPEVKALKKATEPDATGQAATVPVRWYDKPANRKPDATEAFAGIGTVTMVRAQTGADGQVAGWNVTITGQGRRVKIANPATDPTVTP